MSVPATPGCREVEDEIAALTAGEIGPTRARELRRHVEACAACARLAAREARLAALLRSLPPAPDVPLPVPSIDAWTGEPAGRAAARRPRPLRIVWAAGAAAAALLVAWVALRDLPGASVPVAGLTPGSMRIVDEDDPFPSWDDGLLSLVGGAEAVASRRVAEGR